MIIIVACEQHSRIQHHKKRLWHGNGLFQLQKVVAMYQNVDSRIDHYTRHGADWQHGNMVTKAVAKQPPMGIVISALLSCSAP